MNTYKVLHKQVFEEGSFRLVPIRWEDRYDIMQWRNEQIYHLRQKKPLTSADQDYYFSNVVSKLFDHNSPDQLLFSFLKNEECIGYGGLVHINWTDKNAEISFIMNSQLDSDYFVETWCRYLPLIENVGFGELGLEKLFTFAFDLRPKLYEALEKSGYFLDAVLKNHCLFHGVYKNVLIHSKLNQALILRPANISDLEITYEWATNSEIRKYALNQTKITLSEHSSWFVKKLHDVYCDLCIAEFKGKPVGSFRLDIDQKGSAKISYLLHPSVHGKGLGEKLLKLGINRGRELSKVIELHGEVLDTNTPSAYLFRKLGFEELSYTNGVFRFRLFTI